MKKAVLFAVAALGVTARPAVCDVIDSSAAGFTIKITMQIQAPPADVYRKLVSNVGDWWESSHTFSGDAHNLSIDAKAQGCFCEKLPNQGSSRHMEVVTAMPGEKLVLSGGLGPMQSLAVAGSMTFQLSPVEGGTKLEFTYVVGGYSAAGLTSWAKPVDGVLTTQITRLKSFIEHGSPTGK